MRTLAEAMAEREFYARSARYAEPVSKRAARRKSQGAALELLTGFQPVGFPAVTGDSLAHGVLLASAALEARTRLKQVTVAGPMQALVNELHRWGVKP